MKRLIFAVFALAMFAACCQVEPKSAVLIYKYNDGTKDTVTVQLESGKDHLSLHVTKEELVRIDTLCILPEFANATAGEQGGWYYPCGLVTRFKEGREGRYSRHQRHPLPIHG